MKVFISSVVKGLEAERDAVAAAAATLGCEVRRSEDFGAQERAPREACLEGVRWADAVVLILGERYGGELPSGLSATHEEYREARGRGTVLAFVRRDAAFEHGEGEFVAEVCGWQGGLYTGEFAAPEELKEKVTRALHDYAVRRAQTPFEAAALRGRALARIPSQPSSSPTLHMGLAPAPELVVLGPARLQDAGLQRDVQALAQLGANAILDRGEACRFELSPGQLDLVQSPSNRFGIDQQGCITMAADVSHRGGGIAALGVIIEEELHGMLVRMCHLASEVLDAADVDRRLTHVLPACVLDRGYAALRTRAEHAESPTTVTVPMGAQRLEIDWPQEVLVRPALDRDAEKLATDILAQLRMLAQG